MHPCYASLLRIPYLSVGQSFANSNLNYRHRSTKTAVNGSASQTNDICKLARTVAIWLGPEAVILMDGLDIMGGLYLIRTDVKLISRAISRAWGAPSYSSNQ